MSRRAQWWLLLGCGLLVLIVGLLIWRRREQVVGTWRWGSRRAYFSEGGDFEVPPTAPGKLDNFDGGWDWEWMKGRVHFWTTVIDGPNPGWDYELDPTGTKLTAVRGNGPDDPTLLRKISSSAEGHP